MWSFPNVGIAFVVLALFELSMGGGHSPKYSVFSDDVSSLVIDSDIFKVELNLDEALFVVSDHFLSVTIDAGGIRNHWHVINFTCPRLLNLAKGLSPATLRVGGTAQDFVTFTPNETIKNVEAFTQLTTPPIQDCPKNDMRSYTSCSNKISNFTMSGGDWDLVNNFVRKAGWELIFGLNVFPVKDWKQKTWDSSNAEELIRYTLNKGYKVAWELGNEPDLFTAPYDTISPSMLISDVGRLKQLLVSMGFPLPFLAGPDVATLSRRKYYVKYLKSIKPGTINAVTYHQYYVNGATAVEKDFVNISHLDQFGSYSHNAQRIALLYQPGAELWLGETSSAYGSGAPGLSNAYIAGFMWLDKLGMAAIRNHSKVFRQTFKGGSYGLLDVDGATLPDYWLSVLYKALVGSTVLNVAGSLSPGRKVRVYAHCTSQRNSRYDNGDVVLLVLNMRESLSTLSLQNEKLASSFRDIYWLQPYGKDGITSKLVSLNGVLLTLVDNLNLPAMPPKEEPPTAYLVLPPMSFGFIVFRKVKAEACISA